MSLIWTPFSKTHTKSIFHDDLKSDLVILSCDESSRSWSYHEELEKLTYANGQVGI